MESDAPMMRFNSPKADLFDGPWKLADIKLVKLLETARKPRSARRHGNSL
jgi:hypothetical protein